MHRIASVCAMAALACVAGPVLAAPVNYVEAVDGDLRSPSLPTVELTFDLGVNTVSGTYSAQQDYDSFGFIIPAGLYLAGGSVVVTDLTSDPQSVEWDIRAGSTTRFFGTVVQTLALTSPGSDTISPLNAGLYNMSHMDTEGFGTAGYIFTFNVIPEPASLGLLALTSIALLRHRRGKSNMQ